MSLTPVQEPSDDVVSRVAGAAYTWVMILALGVRLRRPHAEGCSARGVAGEGKEKVADVEVDQVGLSEAGDRTQSCGENVLEVARGPLRQGEKAAEVVRGDGRELLLSPRPVARQCPPDPGRPVGRPPPGESPTRVLVADRRQVSPDGAPSEVCRRKVVDKRVQEVRMRGHEGVLVPVCQGEDYHG